MPLYWRQMFNICAISTRNTLVEFLLIDFKVFNKCCRSEKRRSGFLNYISHFILDSLMHFGSKYVLVNAIIIISVFHFVIWNDYNSLQLLILKVTCTVVWSAISNLITMTCSWNEQRSFHVTLKINHEWNWGYIAIFVISNKFFFNPLLFASCTDTVKLLEAWRGVLSSTPYK
jgi:hypothetical protein